MAYNVGLVGPYDHDATTAPSFFASLVNFFPNRTPLVSRLRTKPVNGLVVKQVDDAFRSNSTLIVDANGITNSATAITVTSGDGSQFMPGDTVQVDDELFLVTAANSTTLTVTGGHASTSRAAHNTNSVVYLLSNTRTGSEVDQDAITRIFDASLTYPQTVQHPYQVGGSTEAKSRAMAIPTGAASLLGYQRYKASMGLLDDFERSLYYGKAVALAADTTRPMMQGLTNRIVTNKVTSPTNASAYKPSDFERDFLQPAYEGGGQPDLLVLSAKYRLGFSVWGLNLQQLTPGTTAFGVPIQLWYSPDLGGINVLFSPLLRPYHGFAITSSEVDMGWVREPFDKPRGSRGDAMEGDVIGEGCLLVNNEAHHAWVQGVTGWAKQS